MAVVWLGLGLEYHRNVKGDACSAQHTEQQASSGPLAAMMSVMILASLAADTHTHGHTSHTHYAFD